MGMTIHYDLRTPLTDPEDVRALVVALHQAAARLPFRQVGPVQEVRDRAADFDHSGRDHKGRWLKIQACRHLEVDDQVITVKPRHI